jgi:hypothetical protein
MSRQFSVAVRNAWADAFETTVGVTPEFHLYDGDKPANCGTAAAGTKLLDIAAASDWLTAASAGAKSLSGSWQGNAVANGIAKYYRILAADGTTCHEQGLVSQAHAVSSPFAVGQQVHVGSNVYRCMVAGTTAGATPPSGTGTGITDGSVTWDYIGAKGTEVQNTNVASGQLVQITAYTLTMPNA